MHALQPAHPVRCSCTQAKALKWDADTAEGVVEAVATAGSQEEVDALVEAYMGGDPSAANLVRQFRGPPASGGQPPPAPPAPGMQLYQRDSELRQLESSLRGAGTGAGGSGSSSSAAGGSGRARAPPQAVELPPPAAADKAKVWAGRSYIRFSSECLLAHAHAICHCTPADRRSCDKPPACRLPPCRRWATAMPCSWLAMLPPHMQPLLDMGRNVAVTVKPSKKKGGGGEAGSSSGSGAAKSLANPVVNCLSCGKVRGAGGQARSALQL